MVEETVLEVLALFLCVEPPFDIIKLFGAKDVNTEQNAE